MKLLRIRPNVILLCFLFSTQSLIAQICLNTPLINSAPATGSSPPGWSIVQPSPDVIAGNGPYPGGIFTVSNVNGTSIGGGTMGMFLNNGTNASSESWQTTFTGLTIGQSYSVTVEWQQATLIGPTTYSGGQLLVTVNGIPTTFTSSGGVNDSWQVATVTFTATATTANYLVQVLTLTPLTRSFIVVDNYTCPVPIPLSVALNSGTICQGACFDLIATPSNAVGAVSYSWNQGITSNSPGPINVCPTTTTTYTVTATDGVHISTDSTTIVVNAPPIVNLGNDSTLCNGTTLLLDAQNAGSTYVWQDGSTNQTFAVSAAGMYWVTTVSGACTFTDTINVNFNNPIVDLGPDLTSCDLALTLDAQNAGSTYVWQDGSTNQTFNTTTAGSYWVEVTGTNGCSTIDTIVLTLASLSVNLGNDTVLCNGASLVLDAHNAGSTYVWQDGSTNQTYNTTTAGIYWVEVTGTNGCSTSDTIVLTLASLSVNLGNDTVLCNGASLVLDAHNAGSTYVWQDGSTNQTYNTTTAGIYWVEVTGTNGCSTSDTMVLSSVSINVNLGNDTLLCNSETLILDAQNTGSSYFWQDGSANQTFTVNTAGTYWVNVVDANSCATSDSINVDFTEPMALFSYIDTIGCAPFNVSFTDLSTTDQGTITQWNWNFGDNSTSALQNPTHSYPTSDMYSVTLTVTNSFGCTETIIKDIMVVVYDQTVAAFTYNQTEVVVGQQVFFEDQSVNATSWQWEFGDGSTSTQQNPIYTYSNANEFTILLIASNELCLDTAVIYISIDDELIYYIPNSFTPNGDQFNHTFLPVFTIGHDPSDFKMLLFNRWGEIIFESTDATKGWDGTFNGTMVPDGTYTWKIEFKEMSSAERHSIIGHVNVMK